MKRTKTGSRKGRHWSLGHAQKDGTHRQQATMEVSILARQVRGATPAIVSVWGLQVVY